MHCPVPLTWAHINYTTPSLFPEPAEGSCLQQKSGTSSLLGCSQVLNADTHTNGQFIGNMKGDFKYTNWAGNCGDATSYFWFEKIACGSTRNFDTERSLIYDFVQLHPTPEDLQMILNIFYTTKAPLSGGSAADFVFIDDSYSIPPVLPPKLDCKCVAPMDAYTSLLSVVSKTPTPGAPVTLPPEVLNVGSAAIVAFLRIYQDPTYSIRASAVAQLPVVVTRFYVEVSTKFTRYSSVFVLLRFLVLLLRSKTSAE